MSQVFKCDRCGAIFKNNSYPKYTFFHQFSIDGIKWSTDMCDKCQREFEEWFKNVQSEEN